MNRRGQNITEYGIILVVVFMALTVMNTYFKRGIQGVVKSTSDEFSTYAQQEYTAMTGNNVTAQQLGSLEANLVSATMSPQTMTETSTLSDSDSGSSRTRNGTSEMTSDYEIKAVYSNTDSFSNYEKNQFKEPEKLATPAQTVKK